MTSGAVMEGSAPPVRFGSIRFARAISCTSASSETVGWFEEFDDTELAVAEEVMEGTEPELPMEEPDREVVTDARPLVTC